MLYIFFPNQDLIKDHTLHLIFKKSFKSSFNVEQFPLSLSSFMTTNLLKRPIQLCCKNPAVQICLSISSRCYLSYTSVSCIKTYQIRLNIFGKNISQVILCSYIVHNFWGFFPVSDAKFGYCVQVVTARAFHCEVSFPLPSSKSLG